MSKEMMIVFVYDTLRCLAESDDPADAVLYFHPSWVSDSQRMSLCGQLMGVTHCLKAMFSTPRVLALHSGKFVIQEYGRYVLAVGSDRNIPDWMLKNRAKILVSLIKIFHCDLQTLANHFPGENNPRFSEKLYQIFETYLPTLYHGYYMFQTLPLLSLPKSATSIFLESMQLLDSCRQTNGVVGGAILYNNKILATQLSSKLTSRLCMIDPYRVKLPAESLQVEYETPAGSQLFVVYIKKSSYECLKKDAERVKLWHQNGFEKIKSNKTSKASKEPILGSMKRDKSLLFTAVPEEEINTNSPSPSSPKETIDLTQPSTSKGPSTSSNVPDVVPFCMKPRVRPNKLALSFVTRDSIDEDPKPQVAPGPVFTGQTSVCSTPMLEFKRLHGNVMSICRNADDQTFTEALNAPVAKSPDLSPLEIEALKLNFDEITQKDIAEISEEPKQPVAKELKVTNENVVYKPLVNMRKIRSLSDINSSIRKISHLAAMRLGKSGVTNKNFSVNSDESPVEEETKNRKTFSATITDPFFPVFTNEGVPISKSLYDQYLTMHYDEMTKECQLFEEATAKAKKIFEEFDSNMKMSPVRRQSLNENKLESFSKLDPESPTKPDLRRKSLCLPLKSLGSDKGNGESSLFDSSQGRKKLAGVQLTPLMEKLSHLAFSDKSSGYGSRGVTPMEFKDFQLSTPSVEKTVVFPEPNRKREAKSDTSESESESDDDTQISSYSLDSVRTVMYVCGHQNMSMVLLMDEDVTVDQDNIKSLWNACMSSLSTIEQMCMEPLPGCEDSTEAYSFLSLDPQWGAVKKGGPWASADVATMGYMHNDFQEETDLTEFIVRNEDSLVFGTSCGGAEIYYQESGCKQPGLPTPADLMGTAPLKAKRRLQRDHAVTIF